MTLSGLASASRATAIFLSGDNLVPYATNAFVIQRGKVGTAGTATILDATAALVSNAGGTVSIRSGSSIFYRQGNFFESDAPLPTGFITANRVNAVFLTRGGLATISGKCEQTPGIAPLIYQDSATLHQCPRTVAQLSRCWGKEGFAGS